MDMNNSMKRSEKPTSREIEILILLSKGKTSKDIATDLHISSHTVDTYRRNILKKMQVSNTLQAIMVCTRKEWL